MIHDSQTWKNELENDLDDIRDFYKNTVLDYDEKYEEGEVDEEREMTDVSYVKLEKFAIYSAIVIRKLIEADKISDELMSKVVSIEVLKKKDNTKVTLFNGYEVEELYEIENPEKSTISLKTLTDTIIHSFHFMPKYDWKKVEETLPDDDVENWENNGLLGIYLSSDKSKEQRLIFLDINHYFEAVENVIKDHIYYIQWNEDGVIIKKSSKPK